ncbi:hypothetical protein F5884DRAFT_114449 [Xylogone sp. PMI_703]|nr:hypothetical protein F5884DRAFT_114449 [Xylogone sp. PMI_703]
MSCLPTKISTTADDILFTAVFSIGSALYSNITNSSDMRIMARQNYVTAVQLTRNALQKTLESGSCHLLVVILLLSIFEMFMCEDSESMRAWSSHIQGATTLIELSESDMAQCIMGGERQRGQKTFWQLRSQILTNCIQRSLAVPDVISRWSFTAKGIESRDGMLSAELGNIISQLANFRAAVVGNASSNFDPFVSTLSQMDFDLEKWVCDLPQSWNFKILRCASRGHFYSKSYHKYPGFSIAVMWNHYRTTRCLVNVLLLTYLNPSCFSNPGCNRTSLRKKYHQAEETIRKLCTDVCLSVPYFLRQRDQDDPPTPG